MRWTLRPVLVLVAVAACGDGGGDSPNTAPTVGALTLTTDEDTPVSGNLVVTDAENDPVTISLKAPAHGTITRTGNMVTYTPEPNFHGTDSVEVTVSDGTDAASGTIAITVGSINDAPHATADTFATAEDTELALTPAMVLANDVDVDGDTLTVTAVGNATNGAVALTGGELVFTPAADFSGTGTFEYTVSDGTASATATVTVTVGGANDAPVAVDDAASTDEDVDVTIPAATLLANDTDPENQTLTVTAVGSATNGTVALAGTDVTFTPAANFHGAASFTYTVSDGAATDTATVTVTVNPINDPPVAVDDAVTTAEDTDVVVTAATMLANDTDIDNTTLTVTAAGNATNGTIAFDAGTGDVTFTPTANFVGAGAFTYTVSDGSATATATVAVTITGANDAPVAVDDAATTAEDAALAIAATTLVANDLDIDGDPLTVTAVGNATNGTVALAAGQITFAPAADFHGTASFEYTVSDGTLTDTGVVTVVVTAVNDPPVAVDDTTSAEAGVATDFAAATFLANDSDVDGTPTITAVGNVVNGTVTLNGATITFTGTAVGAASFEYTLSDGTLTDTGVVNVTVVASSSCGDGAVVGTETCDDGDTDDGDGCSATCQVEEGYACTGAPSSCASTCGDGAIAAGVEACDDGDIDGGDGCSATCTVEPGYACTGTPSTCETVCGDGVETFDEQCDDGNTVSTDGCTAACVAGVVCDATALPGADRFAVDALTGSCYASFDDDQTTFADAQAACAGVGGYLATITSSGEQALVASVQNPAQNPWIGASEDGNDTDAVFAWITGEAWGYTNFAADQPDDDVAFGGNGECLHLENAAGEWNDTNCDITAFVTGRICELALAPCGDGVLQPSEGETCDDGNTTAGDGCSASCKLEPLALFTFTGAAGSEVTFPADLVRTGLVVSPMARGSGVSPSSGGNTLSSNGWTTTTPAALDVNDYYTVTVTPNAGVGMTLEALELDERRSSAGIRHWSVRSSLDGFATDLKVFDVPDDDLTRTNQRIDLGAAFANVTTAVEFRIYGWGAEQATGTWRIDNVELVGTTAPAP